MSQREFDIVVIGGGHAGLEASWIAAQMGQVVALLSLPDVPLGSMPCNPSVGGVGKGQVVREIDALGGLMGRLTDLSGIQYRTLNDSKGYAVRSTRVQVDKNLYAKEAESAIENCENIELVRGKVLRIGKEKELFCIETECGKNLLSSKVIVTTGTFLDGKLHTGEKQTAGGMYASVASPGLSSILPLIDTKPNRFKTGTPARLKKSTIDFDKMVSQESDPLARNFHSLIDSYRRTMAQVSCYLTKTNEKTLDVIRSNKERSPLFNGQIKGIGPRYCPSIEDKAFRYLDRNVHHVFVEPEGLEDESVYPSGLSTSLPEDVQETFLKTIPGFENIEILIYGYAVEYDVVDTLALDKSLEYKKIPGLYFAGQVNGTSGYEEAAAQGIIAGINAALSSSNREPFVLDRSESYIGVLIEDLVSNVRDEPYRLFTARAENRLYIREDNTLNRIYEYRKSLGLNSELDKYQEKYIEQYNLLDKLCDETTIYASNSAMQKRFKSNSYGPLSSDISLSELLRRSHLDPVEVLRAECAYYGADFLDSVVFACAIGKKYEGYINRSKAEESKIKRLGEKNLHWEKLLDSSNISYECRQRIMEIRPKTFADLQRIEGIRPATLVYVAGNCLQ